MKSLLLLCLPFLLLLVSPPQKTWVAIGDSITYLNDHADETGNRVHKGYLTRVSEKLTWLHVVNQGHNGWTSEGIAASFDKLGIPNGDVYTIFLGTNDWWQGRRVGELADYSNNTGNNTLYGSFRIITDKIRAINPSAKIVLITPMQRVDFVYLFNLKNNAYGSYKEKNGQSLEAFAHAIIAIGKQEGFPVVDLYHEKKLSIEKLVKFKRVKDSSGTYKDLPYPAFAGVPFNPETDEHPYPTDAIGMTFDGLHPSDAGNAVIAEKLGRVMKKLF
ncbi:MAG: SGNH/GDSL hydrolase family protein [Bacteroidota bacterium]|nr:SGNH/GDSL hydrolase family protein [Bacteroidota bacterium]